MYFWTRNRHGEVSQLTAALLNLLTALQEPMEEWSGTALQCLEKQWPLVAAEWSKELKGSHTKHVLIQDKSNPKKALVAISPCQIHGEELLYTASDNYHLILENHFRPILTDASWEGDTENINEWCFSFIQALNIMKHWSKPPKCLGKAKTSFHFKSIWKHNHGSHWQPWLLDCRPKTTSATGRRRQEQLLWQPCQHHISPRDCRRAEKSVLLEYEMGTWFSQHKQPTSTTFQGTPI